MGSSARHPGKLHDEIGMQAAFSKSRSIRLREFEEEKLILFWRERPGYGKSTEERDEWFDRVRAANSSLGDKKKIRKVNNKMGCVLGYSFNETYSKKRLKK